jgi:hypothetical protein
MKLIPKHIAAAARAQFLLIGRALVRGISQDTFEILLHKWLSIITPLLTNQGFEGKELATAVSDLVQEALGYFDQKDRRKIAASLKVLRVPLN